MKSNELAVSAGLHPPAGRYVRGQINTSLWLTVGLCGLKAHLALKVYDHIIA